MSSVNVTTHTNTQDEAFSAQGNVSRYALPPCIAHPGKLLPSPPFPSVHHSQECLLQKYLMLAGTTRSSFSPPSPGVLCVHVRKGCQSQVTKLPFSLRR